MRRMLWAARSSSAVDVRPVRGVGIDDGVGQEHHADVGPLGDRTRDPLGPEEGVVEVGPPARRCGSARGRPPTARPGPRRGSAGGRRPRRSRASSRARRPASRRGRGVAARRSCPRERGSPGPRSAAAGRGRLRPAARGPPGARERAGRAASRTTDSTLVRADLAVGAAAIIPGMKAGILGLSLVGKSTLFQLLTGAPSPAPGSRPEARVGVARVPDPRVETLGGHLQPEEEDPGPPSSTWTCPAWPGGRARPSWTCPPCAASTSSSTWCGPSSRTSRPTRRARSTRCATRACSISS